MCLSLGCHLQGLDRCLPVGKIDHMSAALIFCQFALRGSQFWQVYFLNLCLPPSSKMRISVEGEQVQWLGLRFLFGAMPVPGELQVMHSVPRQLETLKYLVFS